MSKQLGDGGRKGDWETEALVDVRGGSGHLKWWKQHRQVRTGQAFVLAWALHRVMEEKPMLVGSHSETTPFWMHF